jgi:hypothetical protein
MNVEIGIEAPILEYLFQIFGILSLQCRGPETDMSRTGIEPVGGEHSSKELFEQHVNRYSKHLHMSPRQYYI